MSRLANGIGQFADRVCYEDGGAEAIMLRYPREGHGMRETQHIADFLGRSIAWYERHFASAGTKQTN